MSASMYQQIMSLATQLRQETSVKKRREIGKELLSQLQDNRVQKKLSSEATRHASRRSADDTDEDDDDSKLSVPLRRWYALSQMWRVIILNALVAARNTGSSAGTKRRVKLTEHDILLPYKLLRVCDQYLPCNEENLIRAKLQQNEVKELLQYCLDMLSIAQRHSEGAGTRQSDDAEDVAAFEPNLLEMMRYLCSRIEHVAYYRPDEDMQSILGEVVESRLQYSSGSTASTEKAFIAARIMDALLTSCQKLGVGLHIFTSNCIHLISKWATHQMDQQEESSPTTSATTTKMLPYMLHSVTVLLKCHPEVTIAPMTRWGRPILSLSLKYYSRASTGVHKIIFNDYFASHIVMCQVAGRLQGFMTGDLGNVGPSSLSLRRLDAMLTLVLGESEAMLQKGTHHHKEHHGRTRNSRHKSLLSWQPLSHRQRRHLELGARLLACAQRTYWSKIKYDAMEDPTQALIDTHYGNALLQGSDDDMVDIPPLQILSNHPKEQPANLQDAMASPWIKHIIQPLVTALPLESLTLNEQIPLEQSGGSMQDTDAPLHGNTIGTSLDHYPLLQHLYQLKQQGQQRDVSNVKAIAPLLSVVAACAEAFPSGGCWSSFSADDNWWSVPSKEALEDDELYMIGCSVHDFSLVLFLVSCILEIQGRPHGDTSAEVQQVVLLCLIKLTHCTTVINQQSCQQNNLDLTLIEFLWRHVWTILFRSDLRYSSYTQHLESGFSTGDLVLTLITEIVRLHCTDLAHHKSIAIKRTQSSSFTFLSTNQGSVWNLPVFRDASKTESAAPFLLLCAILQNSGLSDVGVDGIDDTWIKKSSDIGSIASDNAPERNWHRFGRRSRLLSFCLGVVNRLPQLTALRRDHSGDGGLLFGPLAASIAALVNGRGMLLLRCQKFVCDSRNGDGIFPLGFTTLSTNFVKPEASSFSGTPDFYDLLWQLPSFFMTKSPRLIDNSEQVDVVRRVVSNLHESAESNSSLDYVDFVSQRDSLLLHQFVRTFLLDVVWPKVNMTADTEDMDQSTTSHEGEDRWKAPDFALSYQTLALKFILTVSLPCGWIQLGEETDKVTGYIATTFQHVVSHMQPLSTVRSEFAAVMTDLSQILRALIAVSLSDKLHYPLAVTGASRGLTDTCKTLLLNYSKIKRKGMNTEEVRGATVGAENDDENLTDNEIQGIKQGNDTKHEDLSSGTESYGKHGVKRSNHGRENERAKRRRVSHSRTTEPSTFSPPDFTSATLVALLLITLAPSFSHCKLVLESLLGIPFKNGFADEVDFASLAFCLGLISTTEAITHHHILQTQNKQTDFETDKDAVVSLCFDLISRARHDSDPSSLFHLVGYDICAELVCLRETDSQSDPISTRLAEVAAGLLIGGSNKTEVRSLKQRPTIRAKWLQAVTTVFKSGRENVHAVFDQEFRKCLLSSLRDLSEPVRRSASNAVGAAILVFPKQHAIYKRVVDEIPPIVSFHTDANFQRWFSHAETGEKSENTSTNIWEDSFFSFRFESLLCRAVIAGTTTDHRLFREILYDFIRCSFLNPEVEPLAFHSCCKIARMRNYQSCEEMLHYECEGLIQKWLEAEEDVSKMPLILSDPNLLRRLLSTNMATKLSFASGELESLKLSFQKLKEEATGRFLYKYRDLVVPLAYLQAHKHRPESVDNADATDSNVKRKHRYLNAIFLTLVGSDLDLDMARRKILEKHVQDILGLCFPLMASDDDDVQRLGSEAYAALRDELPRETFERFSSNKAHLAARKVLELSGKFEHHISLFDQSRQCYTNALDMIMKELVGEPKSRGDIFRAVGSSATEYLLYTMGWLERALLPIQKIYRWRTVEILCDKICIQLRLGDYDGVQLGFCLSVIVEVLAQPQLSCIQSTALSALKDLLLEACKTSDNKLIKEDISFVLRKIIAVCLFLHESSQEKFLSSCKRQHLESQLRIRRSFGFLLLADDAPYGDVESTGIWGWDLGQSDSSNEESVMKAAVDKYGPCVEPCIVDRLVGTYAVLAIVPKLVDSMTLSGTGFLNSELLSTMEASDVSVLATFNKEFYAQSLLNQLLDEQKNDTKETVADVNLLGIVEAIKNQKSWLSSPEILVSASEPPVGNFEGQVTLNGLTSEQRLLWIELTQLAKQLQQHPLGTTKLFNPSDELLSLMQELIFLCGAPCPEPLRCVASRCLGEVGQYLQQAIPMYLLEGSRTENLIEVASGTTDFITAIHIRCYELLSQYMNSPCSKSALAAMETARALLATKDGLKVWALVQRYHSKELIAPLRSRRTQVTPSCLLPDNFFDEIISEMGDDISIAKTQRDWCWNERFWTCKPGLSFESFIRRLVAALLACCYGKSKSTDSQLHVKGKSHFFHLCQKMCALEHDFASAIFPGIVLDLLQCDANETKTSKLPCSPLASAATDDVVAPRLANDRLTTAFTSLLRSFVTEYQGSDHRIPTLVVDTLHMLRRSSQITFVASDSHKPNTEPSTGVSQRSTSLMRGIPFGVILRLDGWLVAQACLRINRVASALIFVDLFAEERFRGSGAVLPRLNNTPLCHTLTQCTNGLEAQLNYHSDDCKNSDDAMSIICLLKQSYSQLHEFDNLRVAENYASALQLANDNANIESIEIFAPSIWELQQLDTQSRTNANQSNTSLKVASCLDSLGLGSILDRYIHATTADQSACDAFTESELKALREKWFEGQLHHGRWNDNTCKTKHLIESPFAADTLPFRAKDGGGFHERIGESLTALLRDDVYSCRSRVEYARKALLSDSASVFSGESLFAGFTDVVDKLKAMNEIEAFSHCLDPCDIVKKWGLQERPDDLQNIYGVESDLVPLGDLTLSLREIMLHMYISRQAPEAHSEAGSVLVTHLWQYCASARHQGRPERADSTLQRLRSILNRDNDTESKRVAQLRLRLEEAMIMESRGDFASAIRHVRNLIEAMRPIQKQTERLDLERECLLTDSLAKCGGWTADYKVEPAKAILESYLLPASVHAKSVYEADNCRQNAGRATSSFLSLAHLASALHESTSNRIRSTEWTNAGRRIQDRELELRKCERLVKEAELQHRKFQEPFRLKNQKNQSKEALAAERNFIDLHTYKERLRKELLFLTTEREKLERSVREHLNRALKSFGTALSLSGTENTGDMQQHVFKMVSLWLANYRQIGNGENVNNIMKEVFGTVPTFRFIPLTYQIFSRLEVVGGDGPDKIFQEQLKILIFKMCDDHPYHCIVQLIALSNGLKVAVGSGVGTSERSANDFRKNVGDSKSAAASELVLALESEGKGYVTKLVQSYQALTDAYMHLAMASTTQFHQGAKAKKPILISRVCSPKLRLDSCLRTGPRSGTSCMPCVLTKPPPLRPGCDYGDGIEDPIGAERVAGFEPSFKITETGINRPKIVMCLGSKGTSFKQLVKGQDDIRQDAIMQQVFQYVNSLMADRNMNLSSKPSTTSNATLRKFKQSSALPRSLKLITYHIVPLSPITGVLEWVEDAIPIGDYLNDKGTRGAENAGAHSRYYPGEWANKRCREHLKNAPDDEKRKSFDDICLQHSPCFRFFFHERFGDSPPAWYTAKMKYTRSVAVSSIVGHVLGIGDRHSNNILVHQKTGEVVHIDFGIVFEQGKLLTKPEVVPFRLTRNIVDGMGPCGTEGAFCSAAEATAAALRENSSALLTILSAVVSDPLYKWSVSPIKALRRQRMSFRGDDGEDDDDMILGRLIPQKHSREDEEGSMHSEVEQHDNEAAAQAIARIHEKLQGYEDGTAGEQQSVESQVQLLINSARDGDNLCVMFEGWAPWS